jgi:SpoVK/Ycf46/Vps4 family AAA+-type ATPase
MLSCGEMIFKRASELVGSHVGDTEAKMNALFDSAAGKVILIDEAYNLVSEGNVEGPKALNVLVERIQNADDFAVVLCGYTDEMTRMLDEQGNTGLSRRFDESNRFLFEDYTKEQLFEILMLKVHGKYILSSDVALRAIESEVEPCRPKRGFGNAGLIDDLLKKAALNFNGRSDGNRQGGLPVLIESDLISLKKAPELRFPQQEIDDYFKDLEVTLNEEKGKKDFKMAKFIEKRVQNWRFVGPAGTGKTSTAQAFAQRLYELGIFSRREAIVLKASEACAGWLGQTALKVNEMLQKARGGVLVFDEAYALLPKSPHDSFKIEALEQLLAALDTEACKGQMCVILTGYKKEISQLLAYNQGLPRRFMKELDIPPWTPAQCTAFLRSIFDGKGEEPPKLPQELDGVISDCFSDLQGYSDFSNAGDVKDAVVNAVENLWAKRAKKVVPGQKVQSHSAFKSCNQNDCRSAKSRTSTYHVKTSSKRLKN